MTTHGGRRPGSGRKPGGVPPLIKKIRSEARAVLANILGTERDPLLVAIAFANDPKLPVLIRLEAALGACRYVHPKVSSMLVDYNPAQLTFNLEPADSEFFDTSEGIESLE